MGLFPTTGRPPQRQPLAVQHLMPQVPQQQPQRSMEFDTGVVTGNDFSSFDRLDGQAQQQEYYEEAPQQPPEENFFVSAEDFDASLGAIQERIRIANYFQALLEADLFNGDDSDVAWKVQSRVKSLLQQEAEIVLGIRSSRIANEDAATFTPDEVAALKVVAAKVLNPSPRASQPVVQAVAPAARPVVTPPATQPTVSVVTVRPQGQPQQRQKPQPPPAPAPKPAPQPMQRNKPRPQVQQQAQVQAQQPMESTGPVQHERIPGLTKAEGRVKRTIVMPDQNLAFTQDMTPQQINNARVPMPSHDAMTQVTAQQAMQTVSAQGATGARVVHAAGGVQGFST